MQKELRKRELRRLAAQLRCPTGQMGLDVAQLMHTSNISMTLEGMAALDLSTSNTILELGHGNCAHLPKILNLNNEITYHGLEISTLMIQEARKINDSYVTDRRAVFEWYDGVHIPYPDQKFDKILTVNTIYFWREPLQLLHELYRVLRPGGHAAIAFAAKEFLYDLSFANYGFTMYNRTDFKTLISQTDFEILKFKRKKEFIKNKLGNFTERIFLVATLSKK